MASKDDFTDEEWQVLENALIGAGIFVSVSEPDFTHTRSESNAIETYVSGQRETGESELVRELANIHVNPYAFNQPSSRIEEETLAALRFAAATLAAKAPREVDAYCDFVLGVADCVAADSGGVRPGETAAIGKIREALGRA